jgi:hypothetical protein
MSKYMVSNTTSNKVYFHLKLFTFNDTCPIFFCCYPPYPLLAQCIVDLGPDTHSKMNSFIHSVMCDGVMKSKALVDGSS